MGKNGEKSGNSLAEKFQKVIGVLAALAVAAGAVTAFKDFAGQAAEAAQQAKTVQVSFESTFGESSKDVENWSGNFANAIHRNETEVKSFLVSNKALYESMGLTGAAANEMSEITTSLAYDLGRFAGIDDSEALSKMQDAISGNAAALADYGVKLDGATLKQTAQSMGISTAIEDMDEATAAQVRMNAILSQTSQMQGEASRSLGGYAGGMKAIQAATQGFMEKAGNKLAPMFDKIFSTILNLWPKVEPAVMAFVGTLGDGIADLIPTITEMAEEFLPSLIAVFSDLAPVILQVAKDVLPPLMQAFGTVMTSIQPLLPLIGDLIHSLLPPLADIFTSLLRSILPPLIDIIKAILPPIPKLWILFFQHYCLLLTLFYQLSIY